MNWQLKHRYALFGFKKGVTDYTAMTEDKKFYAMSNNDSKDRILKTSQMMMDRYGGNNNAYGSARINAKTGKTVGNDLKTIVIGIPYQDRAKDDIKGMIELIWQIENRKIEAQPESAFTVTAGEVAKNAPARDLEECVSQFSRSDGMSDIVENVINDYNQQD